MSRLREGIYVCGACGATQLVKWNDQIGENSWEKLRETGDWERADFVYCPNCAKINPRPPQKFGVENDRVVPVEA